MPQKGATPLMLQQKKKKKKKKEADFNFQPHSSPIPAVLQLQEGKEGVYNGYYQQIQRLRTGTDSQS